MDSLEIHQDTQYNSLRDSKVAGKKTVFATVSVILILMFTGGSQSFATLKLFTIFCIEVLQGLNWALKRVNYSPKNVLHVLYLISLPERNDCLISSYIWLKMNKCEQRTPPHDAKSSRAQEQWLSPRQGWQSQPQQPAQRACLSRAGHRHPVQLYLSCYIPVTHMFLLGFERSSLSHKELNSC